jgi:TolA-binding protein
MLFPFTEGFIAPSVFAEDFAVVKASSANTEDFDRRVDEAASASEEKAIGNLKVLTKKYAGMRQEPTLLSKLAEIQQQHASMLFRIAHGATHRGKKALDLTRYNKAMQESLSTLDALIAKYPSFEEIPHAYFMRGKGYEEIGKKTNASSDYHFLVEHFPDSEDTTAAYMSLAEFAIDANDHPHAITYLKEVEKKPADSHYPFALYKLAWSHYNLKNIRAALSYAEKQVVYYNEKKQTAEGDITTSDNALRENTLLDSTIFYFEGYEEKIPQYQLTEALDYFKKLDNGPTLGKMLARFAKLLRSHGYEADLIAWKDQCLASESNRAETLDVLLTTFELQLMKRRYSQLIESSQDIVRLYTKNKDTYKVAEGETSIFVKAQKMLLDTAEGLQTLVVKNKDATEVHSYSTTLAAIYDAFVKIVDDKDPRIPRVHYNLAETLFTIKDYPAATENYRWVVDHGVWPDPSETKEKGKVAVENVMVPASLKAIASRYEVLRQKGLIPKDLQPKPLKDDTNTPSDPMISQWVEWIDAHIAHSPKDVDIFAFEAARALYSQGHIKDALERMAVFAKKHPDSKYSIPSASLIIDSYVAAEDWEKTYEQSTEFLEVKEWKSTEFSKRLYSVAADSFYKQIEALNRTNDFQGVLKRSDLFIKLYSDTARLGDTLALAGNAALVVDEKKRAADYFSRLIKEVPKSNNVAGALLARASLEEDHYQFSAAASDYKAYLAISAATAVGEASKGRVQQSSSQIEVMRKKTLALIWLTGDLSELRAALDTKSICDKSVAQECEKYSALAAFSSHTTVNSFENSQKSSGQTQTLWAALALENAKELSFKDRLQVLSLVAEGWENLDPISKFYLVPYLSTSIPRTFQLNRTALGEVAPLKAEEKAIKRRIETIKDIEAAATKTMKLPWSRIKAETLNEVASLYLDLSRELSALPPPKNLTASDQTAYEDTIRKITLPFEEKGQDMRGKAFEIASRNGIEEKSFNAITEPFFNENPSQAKALKPAALTKHGKAGASEEKSDSAPGNDEKLGLEFLAKIDPAGDWAELPEISSIDEVTNPATRVKILWVAALQEKRWQQVAFFMQEAQEKALIQAGVMGTVKAVSLAAAGAQGEALSELEEARTDLDIRAKTLATTTLVNYSLHACAREHTKSLLKDLPKEQSYSKDAAALIASAEAYANPDAGKNREPAGH